MSARPTAGEGKPLHLREQLLTGRYIAVQDHTGRIIIGTPDEAIECMMEGT